ncbi:hypothetical protein B5V01_31775 [Mesorhizobium erdmanii]|uniref:Uncharacterized protein n=2 Tax=Mesorhizobium TaxID=68287 RepID=A0A3M9XEG9_9HYPH|nr:MULTISPECIES: hypothetical protein [Mesorhizobium]RNJ46423.1 hypothetical protein DNR46_00440 [Mesorhizobium japonicum]RXT34943.1 hypothetical protein B5V01_31775 [Mesorhizobium erdmanii]
MEKVVDKAVGPIYALFSEMGGIVFVPVILVATAAGLYLGGMMSAKTKGIIMAIAFAMYFGWSLVFVFSYEYTPGQSRHMISGWRLNPPAEEYIEQNPALRQMSRDYVSSELVKNFKAPVYVWDGTDLFFSKAMGWVSMAAILLALGVLLSSFRKEKAKS